MNIASEIRKQSFARPSPELFDKVADEVARTIVEEGAGRANKATQIRKFYDELELWNERVQQAPNPQGKLDEVLPYILMLRAKCAYAASKKQPLVSRAFVEFLTECLTHVRANATPAALHNAKLFFEAVLAFGKQHERSAGRR